MKTNNTKLFAELLKHLIEFLVTKAQKILAQTSSFSKYEPALQVSNVEYYTTHYILDIILYNNICGWHNVNTEIIKRSVNVHKRCKNIKMPKSQPIYPFYGAFVLTMLGEIEK